MFPLLSFRLLRNYRTNYMRQHQHHMSGKLLPLFEINTLFNHKLYADGKLFAKHNHTTNLYLQNIPVSSPSTARPPNFNPQNPCDEGRSKIHYRMARAVIYRCLWWFATTMPHKRISIKIYLSNQIPIIGFQTNAPHKSPLAHRVSAWVAPGRWE